MGWGGWREGGNAGGAPRSCLPEDHGLSKVKQPTGNALFFQFTAHPPPTPVPPSGSRKGDPANVKSFCPCPS